jgi:hypothetical protein
MYLGWCIFSKWRTRQVNEHGWRSNVRGLKVNIKIVNVFCHVSSHNHNFDHIHGSFWHQDGFLGMNKDLVTHNLVTSKIHHPFMSFNCGNQHLIHRIGNIVICIVCSILGNMQGTSLKTKHNTQAFFIHHNCIDSIY